MAVVYVLSASGEPLMPTTRRGHVRILLKEAPKLRKKYKRIANGTNNKYREKIMHTPSGDNPNHYTWWLYDGVMPHTFFEICNEGGEING